MTSRSLSYPVTRDDLLEPAGRIAGFLSHLAVFGRPGARARFHRIGGKALLECAERLRPTVLALVDEALSDLAAAGPPADLVSTVHLPVPIRVISELIGVPHTDQHTFRGWTEAFFAPDCHDQDRIAAARRDMDTYLRDLLARRRAEPGIDYLSTMLTTPDIDGTTMSEEEVLATTYALLISGYGTVAHALGKGMLALFGEPEQLDALRADPSRVGSAVEEFLRYAPRLSFGLGVRHCTGTVLARMQLEAVLAGLLRRFPELRLAIPAGEVVGGVIAEGPRELPVTW